MKAPFFVLTPDQRERPLNVVGTQVTVLASNAASKAMESRCSEETRARARRRTATTGTKRSTY
jgi:hypothetical protein